MAKVFHRLVTPEEAVAILSSNLKRLIGSERRALSEAAGFVSHEDVFSSEDVPPFDRSEVDGYVVHHSSVIGAEEDLPAKLRVIGEVEIGQNPNIEIRKGTAVYISTGAMMPRGADSVVMVEFTSREGVSLSVYRSVSPGENIAHAGSDFFVGESLLRRSEVITSEAVALLASSGIGRVSVNKKLNIGIVSTGDELVSPGNKLELGEIYDSNAYYFKAALDATGLAECRLLGTLADDMSQMKAFIKKSMGKFDVLMSSGSTSAGFHDLLYRAIEELGGEMLFHGISIKPGKPTFAASLEGCVFLGMPGFPLSAASVTRFVVIPAIKSAYGQTERQRSLVSLPFRMNSEKGKVLVLPAIIGRSGRAYPIFGESGSISRLAYADGFVIIESTRNFYEREDRIPFFPLNAIKRDLLFIGSNDPLIERVIFEAARFPSVINAGSWGGVEAIRLGEADVSGVHLMKDGRYNTFLLRENEDRDFCLVRGFSRTQGMISRDGTSSFSQVYRNKSIFVNRNRGSGTRDLIDSEIRRELGPGFEKEGISGYLWEAKSHAAVAKAVQQGRADAGVSIEFYASILNLKFHKIRDENYDILMQKSFYGSSEGKRFVSKLKAAVKYSSEFPGYKFPRNIGELIS